MEASAIYKSLFFLFHNYEYKLCNSYIYNWESDFFAVSKAGYSIEVEVKVSRGDYFRDFEKDKHLLFSDHLAKKTHHIYRNKYRVLSEDSVICSYWEPIIEFDYNGKERKSHWKKYNWHKEIRNGVDGYLVNDYGHSWVQKRKVEIFAKSTHIQILPINEILCPNSLYYAVPKGLIKPNELPAYAGLIEIPSGFGSAEIIKKAPYMHKVKHSLTSILLSKYYNLWNYKMSYDKQIEVSTKLKESNTENI